MFQCEKAKGLHAQSKYNLVTAQQNPFRSFIIIIIGIAEAHSVVNAMNRIENKIKSRTSIPQYRNAQRMSLVFPKRTKYTMELSKRLKRMGEHSGGTQCKKKQPCERQQQQQLCIHWLNVCFDGVSHLHHTVFNDSNGSCAGCVCVCAHGWKTIHCIV